MPRPTPAHRFPWVLAICTLSLTLLQTLLGALVRGSLEILLHARPDLPRGDALGQLGGIEELHKAAAVLTVLLCGALFATAHVHLADQPVLRRLTQVPIWIALSQFTCGLMLASRALPPSLQLAHLVGASLLFGVLTLVALLLSPARIR